jgi:hypothetical protein
MPINKITAPRSAPFMAETDGTLDRYRLIKVDPVTNTAVYAEDGANAISIAEALPEYNNTISFLPTGDTSGEQFLTLGGVVNAGDYLNADAEGKGVKVTTKAEGCAQALSSGIANQVIAVRMFLL